MMNIDSTTKQVYDLVSSGAAINTSLIGEIGGVTTALGGVVSQIQSIGDNTLAPIINDLQSTVGSTLTSLQGHVTNQFSNLTRNLSLYTGDFSLQQGLGVISGFPSPSLALARGIGSEASPQSVGDICRNVNDFFGSIIGQGKELLEDISNGITALVNQVTALANSIVQRAQAIITGVTDAVMGAINAAIDAAKQAINAVVDKVKQVANEVTEMIQREVTELTDALKRALDFTDAVSFRGLFQHPCAKTVLGAVGSGGLIATLTSAVR